MADIIVPYARFVEVRERRQRAIAELIRESIDTPDDPGGTQSPPAKTPDSDRSDPRRSGEPPVPALAP
jgi:hypothetical protein